MSGTNIPLMVDPAAQAGPNIGAVINQANALTGLQANQQALAGQNALRGILGNPANMDPATGMPKQNAMAQIAGADPDAWLRLQQVQKDTAARTAQMQEYALKRHMELQEVSEPIRVAALDAYKKARDAGADEASAQAAGQAIYTPMVDDLKASGVLSDTEKQQLSPRFDPQRAWANSDKWQQIQKQQDDQKRADAKAAEEARHNKAMEGQHELGNPTSAQYTDPDTKKPTSGMVVYDKADGKYLTADGRKPIEGNITPYKPPIPGSMAADREAISQDLAADPDWKDKKPSERAAEVERQIAVVSGKMTDPKDKHALAMDIASYKQAPLTGYAMSRPGSIAPDVMREVSEINPDYQATRYPEINRAMTEFGSGKLGSITRSMNVGIQHLDSIDALGKALQNGDIRLINSAAQAIKTELGVPAPVTFDAAKQIVADEIVKAIVGYSGAVNDRESMQEKLNKANSPEQLLAVTKEFRTLMAGQLQGLRKQYEDATGFKSGPFAFDSKLLPATRRELGVVDKGETGATQGAAAAPAAGATTPAWTSLAPDKRTAALDYLKAHPETKDHFVAMFGAGAVPGETAAPAAGGGTAPLPMPKSAAEAVKGKVYQTKRGPATWDGKQFIPVP